jgi:threonine/homoserine/homoserine lactone efflux protein
MSLSLPTRLTVPVIFGVALATGFSGAVVPGSLLAVVITNSVRFGWVAGPIMMIGHGVLELAAVVLLTTGLIKFARSPVVRGAIGLIGGLVLLYLGCLTVQVSGEASAAGGQAATSWLHLVLLGGVMSMANPYWWLWWATIGVAHVGWATQKSPGGGVTYFTGHILSDVAWYSAVSVALAAGRSVFSPPVLRGIYVVCGVFLLALGLLFIIGGARSLRQRRDGHSERSEGLP